MRGLFTAVVAVTAFSAAAQAQVELSFTTRSGPAFAILGCDVVGPGEPEVEFLQVADRFTGRVVIGVDDFQGESCAGTLSALLGGGFRLLTSRTVQESASREIIVYDLIDDRALPTSRRP